ncbi:MAG: TetR/AcrR family transcriptional regulator [Pseudorhodoplanes sp.]|uniref:TetR/AcrR family transcriptional regulator n=1 Tax=Pseudorhodoplanes sp. TaxID=1934341 RepID=UPI003D111879
MRLIEHQITGTPLRIMESAMRLFAQSGLDAVSVREIALDANVNGAAINYHFGTKEQLIREIFRRLFGRVNELRTKALDDYETGAVVDPPEAEPIIRAFIEPLVQVSFDEESGGIYLVPLLFHAFGVRRDFIDKSIYDQVDDIFVRFAEALQRAFPRCGREEVFWRLDFAIGACQHILLDRQRSHRLKRLSGGLCNTADPQMIIEQLVASVIGCMSAPAKSRPAEAIR